MKNRLTREQRKIIYFAAIAVLFLFCFWIFIYRPQNKDLSSIKEELNSIEAQISEITDIAQGRELADVVKDFNLQLKDIESFLSLGEAEIIYNLSQKAGRLGVTVRSIIPSDKHLLENNIFGFEVEELPISMSLSCEYRELGMYLNTLRTNFPALVRIKELSIKGSGEGGPVLDVNLQLCAYLSKAK